MSQTRSFFGVVAVDDKNYAIGGLTDYDKIFGTNERYDTKTDKWVTLSSMPIPRHSFGIFA